MKIRLVEELSKSDESKIRKIVKNEIETKLDGHVAKRIKSDTDAKENIKDIVVKVLEDFYRTLWMQRNFWTKTIK